MLFADALLQVSEGYPIFHKDYGTFYRTSKKESFFIHKEPKAWQKIVVTNLHVIVRLPIDSNDYEVADTTLYQSTDGWEVIPIEPLG